MAVNYSSLWWLFHGVMGYILFPISETLAAIFRAQRRLHCAGF